MQVQVDIPEAASRFDIMELVLQEVVDKLTDGKMAVSEIEVYKCFEPSAKRGWVRVYLIGG